MKKQLVATATGFALFSIMLPLKAIAASFSQLFVFGDSLSDTGNVFNFTRALGEPTQVLPPSPPYFEGRFSNGNIWVEYFGDELGLTPTLLTATGTTIPTGGINFAFGGASTGLGNTLDPDAPLPGVLAQVGLFAQPLLANNQKVDSDALYVVWGGAADYIFGGVTDVNQPVTNLSNAVGLLAQAGAKNIVVFNLPDLGKNPFALSTENPSAFTTLTTEHNAKLAASLLQFSSIPDINIIPVDVYSLFNQVSTNPGEFGFTNVTASCLVGDFDDVSAGNFSLCDNPDEYLFWDAVHPTTRTHSLVADAALAAVGAKSVPEPSTALGMLALGVGAAGVLKRKQKHNYLLQVFCETKFE